MHAELRERGFEGWSDVSGHWLSGAVAARRAVEWAVGAEQLIGNLRLGHRTTFEWPNAMQS